MPVSETIPMSLYSKKAANQSAAFLMSFFPLLIHILFSIVLLTIIKIIGCITAIAPVIIAGIK